LSRELWWTGSLVAVFENKNRWETTEIPGWFSTWGFGSTIKNFMLLWEMMLLENDKIFTK
jgi:hypothetical protein